MAMVNPYQKYQQQNVMTASPGELTLMLYNGCAKFIRQAKIAIDKNEIEKAGNAILKAQDIIQELITTLNMDYDISNQLFSLYDYIYRKLVDGNISKDVSVLDEALNLVIQLSDTWGEVIKTNRKQIYGG